MIKLTQQQKRIAYVVAAYFVVSISLVFVNKVLVSYSEAPAPLFSTWVQCVITVLVCWILGLLSKSAPPGSFLSTFPSQSLSVPKLRATLPLSIVFVGMIGLNMLCMSLVEASFYNIARSLTIVFNVMLSSFVLGQNTSTTTLLTMVPIVAGFYIGSVNEMNYSALGTFFGVSSSFFVALNGVMTRDYLEKVADNNTWRLAFYNNVNASIIFLPLILVSGEFKLIMQHSLSFSYVVLQFLGGILGFLIGIVTIMQIKETSPLTHNVSGTAKSALQTALAFLIFQNPTNFLNVFGILLVLVGTMLYTYVRNNEMNKKINAYSSR